MATFPGYRRTRQLAYRRLETETVVLDPRGRLIVGLNGAGGELLDGLSEPRSLELLAGVGLPATPPGYAATVGAFLEELVALGLAERVDSAESPPAGEPRVLSSGELPAVLWREAMVEVGLQTSPPQAITNPQCHP